MLFTGWVHVTPFVVFVSGFLGGVCLGLAFSIWIRFPGFFFLGLAFSICIRFPRGVFLGLAFSICIMFPDGVFLGWAFSLGWLEVAPASGSGRGQKRMRSTVICFHLNKTQKPEHKHTNIYIIVQTQAKTQNNTHFRSSRGEEVQCLNFLTKYTIYNIYVIVFWKVCVIVYLLHFVFTVCFPVLSVDGLWQWIGREKRSTPLWTKYKT